ncbi:hypothetical protein NECAME_17737, partial [Necator americanus]
MDESGELGRDRLALTFRRDFPDDEEIDERRGERDGCADKQGVHERMRLVDHDAGDDRRKRAAEIAAEVLHAAERRNEMAGGRHTHERPGRAARHVHEEHRNGNIGDGERGARRVGGRHGERRRADQADTQRPFAAADGRHAALEQVIRNKAAARHADRAEHVGNGDKPARMRNGDMTLLLQIARQPREIEPHHVDHAHEAEDHAPRVALLEQHAPLGEAQRALFRGFGRTVFEPCRFFGGERDLIAVAIDDIPADRDEHAQHAHDDEHRAPAECEHQHGEERRRDHRRDGRRGDERAGWRAAFAHGEPLVNDLGAGRKERRFGYAQHHARRQKMVERLDETARDLCKRPHEHAEPEHHARAEPVEHRAHRQLRERVSERECRKQQAHLRSVQMQFLCHRMIGDGKRAAIQIVHDARYCQKGDGYRLRAFEPLRFFDHGVS